jgi:hypothetical protein
MNETLMNVATVFLMLFGLIAAVDGLYLHLWKYRLYAQPDSLYEHKLHTAQGLLFIPIVFLLFYANFGGWALWAGIFFLVVETAIEVMDVLSERDSRAALGGLTPLEYALHALAIMFRTFAIALALAVKPASAWSLSSPVMLDEQFAFASSTAFNTIVGNMLVVALHFWLMRGKYRAREVTNPLGNCCLRPAEGYC